MIMRPGLLGDTKFCKVNSLEQSEAFYSDHVFLNSFSAKTFSLAVKSSGISENEVISS